MTDRKAAVPFAATVAADVLRVRTMDPTHASNFAPCKPWFRMTHILRVRETSTRNHENTGLEAGMQMARDGADPRMSRGQWAVTGFTSPEQKAQGRGAGRHRRPGPLRQSRGKRLRAAGALSRGARSRPPARLPEPCRPDPYPLGRR